MVMGSWRRALGGDRVKGTNVGRVLNILFSLCVCGHRVMESGQACAETLVRVDG